MKKCSAFLLAGLMLLSLLAGCASQPTETDPGTIPGKPVQTDPTEPQVPTISIKEALELCGEEGNVTEERYYIRATVETVTNAQYGAMVITDGTDSIPVYGTYSADGSVGYADMADKPYKGDTVLLHCILQNYKGKKEIKNARLISFQHTAPDLNEEDYTSMTVLEARKAKDGTLVKVQGVVAKITYANGMKPNGFLLADDTQSIYVYDVDAAQRVQAGNKITLLASKTYWILDKEQEAAQKYGYQGCCQLENAVLKDNDNKTDNTFQTDWIIHTSVKHLMDAPLDKNITTSIFKVDALIHKEAGSGFTNYYIRDLDEKTGSYCYSQCSGEDFSWLDPYDGKICTLYLTVQNAKSTGSGCFYRFLPVAVLSDDYQFDIARAASFAVKYHGVTQFNEFYTGDPALELVTSVSSQLLGFRDVRLSYKSDNTKVVRFTQEGSKLVMHCAGTGTATITVTGSCNGKEYRQELTVKVDSPVVENSMTVQQAADTKVGELITVKGIIGPSLVNKDGFYLIDDTGVIAVTMDKDKLQGLAIGQEIILKGQRDRFIKDGAACHGQTCITHCDIVANHYGKHEYNNKTFLTGKTLADFAALDVTKDYSRSVYILKATVTMVETPYYTTIKLVDGGTEVRLYCSSAKQYSWLQQFDGQEVTLELAACNWNSKKTYAGCVLAVYTDGAPIYNELCFQH